MGLTEALVSLRDSGHVADILWRTGVKPLTMVREACDEHGARAKGIKPA
jgi:hypothetical protein